MSYLHMSQIEPDNSDGYGDATRVIEFLYPRLSLLAQQHGVFCVIDEWDGSLCMVAGNDQYRLNTQAIMDLFNDEALEAIDYYAQEKIDALLARQDG